MLWTNSSLLLGETWQERATMGVVFAVVAVIIILFNLLLITSILSSSQGRRRDFHVHIVNLAVANLLQGAGVLPLWANYLLTGSWNHSESACIWVLAADVMATTASALAIVVMACDRYMYLLCWRRIREGCKYVVCCILMATVWLLAAILTLFFTVHTKERFADEQAAGDLSSKTGVYRDHCRWGAEKLKEVVIAQLVVFGLGAVLGTGLSVALVIMSCFATGPGLLPIEEDGELAMDERGESDIEEEEEGVPEREKSPINRRTSHRGSLEEMSTDTLDRHEERERWRGQVMSLLVVALAWGCMWLPLHLFLFQTVLRRVTGWDGWHLPPGFEIAIVVTGYSNAAVTPLLWLCHRPIRSSVADFLCCRQCLCNEEQMDKSDKRSKGTVITIV